ncbi:hypothetical protein CHUAL_008371 [Chamberlinius hualienensis]
MFNYQPEHIEAASLEIFEDLSTMKSLICVIVIAILSLAVATSKDETETEVHRRTSIIATIPGIITTIIQSIPKGINLGVAITDLVLKCVKLSSG